MSLNEVLEIVEFRVRAGVSDQGINDALEGLVPDLRMIGGFVSQDVYGTSDGGWVLLYRWKTLEDAQASTDRMMGRESFARLLELVEDPSAIRMTYAERR